MFNLFHRLLAHATLGRVAAAGCSAAVLIASGVAWAAGIR